MAISLSFGEILLISLSSIYICPFVISSRPATILNVVDLPHPEGPTNITNSLSFILILKSSTAITSQG